MKKNLNISNEELLKLDYKHTHLLKKFTNENGKIIPQAPIKTIQPTHGKDLILTLDSELQFISENLCSEALEKTEALNCSIVFANANTGEILIAAEKSGMQSKNCQKTVV